MFNRMITNTRSWLLVCSAGFCFFLLTSCFGETKNGVIKSADDGGMKISWNEPIKDKDKTIIHGYARTDSGLFEFMWIIKSEKESKLVAMKAPGSAELPLKEKKVMPMVLSDGVTLLFQEWPPLLNEKKPLRIRLIASVSTAELFSVLPDKIIPQSCIVPKAPEQIKWGTVFNKKGIKYIQGTTRASFGSLNLLWKKDGAKNPELIVEERPGAGELPAVERKLLPWIDETGGFTFICQERLPQLNQGSSPYLWCLTAVKTEEILSAYELINSQEPDKK